MAKGTKSEAKAKKAGTSTTSTKAEPESVSPNLTLLSSSGQSGSSKSQSTLGNPTTRATPSPGSKAAKSTAEPSTQGSISQLAAISSPKSVRSGGNPIGVTSLSIGVRESSGSKAKRTARKTPSPGKSPIARPTPPPPPKYSRKTPSPVKTGSPKLQLQNPLKVDVKLATKGRKTPSPNVSRKTPSPSVRKTSSPNVTGRKTPSPNVSRKAPSPNVNRKTPSPSSRKTPSPNVGKKISSPSLVPKASSSPSVGRKTPSPNKVIPGPSISPKLVTSPKTASPKPHLTNLKGTRTNPNSKSSSSKDGKSPKAKVKKSPGATTSNKDKTAVKSENKGDKLKVLKTKKKKDITTGSVTKKIKKKNLKNMKKKLKVVLGLHTKSAKLAKPHASPIKKPPSPPKAKSPIQAVVGSQSSRAAVVASPKKPLTSSSSNGKPRPRIDDIARRLSIENREKREEKRFSGKESPGLFKEGGNGKKEKSSDSRRNSKEKEEKTMKIRMVPVVCPWSWKGEPEFKPVSNAVSTCIFCRVAI